MLDLKFKKSTKRSYNFHSKNSVDVTRLYFKKLNFRFNKIFKKILFKFFDNFDQLFFIKIVKLFTNHIQDVMIFDFLVLTKYVRHLKELMKISVSLFYKIVEFIINLNETDQIKIFIEELKKYQMQTQKIQSKIEDRITEHVMLQEISVIRFKIFVKIILNNAENRVAIQGGIKIYENLIKIFYKIGNEGAASKEDGE